MPDLDTTSECEVCARLHSVLFDFFARYQYELACNQEVRARHAETGGFCPLHTWQYAEIASPRGICAAYADVCRAWSRRLKESGGHRLPGLPDTQVCPACRRRCAAESECLQRAAEEARNGATVPPPLCLPHLAALSASLPPESFQRLVERQAAVYTELAENMESYAQNYAPGRRTGLSQAHKLAHRIGLSRLVGHRRLLTPWEFERTF